MNIILLLSSSSSLLLFPCTCHVLRSKMPIFSIVFLTREQEERTVNSSIVKPRFTDTYTDISLSHTVWFVTGKVSPYFFSKFNPLNTDTFYATPPRPY